MPRKHANMTDEPTFGKKSRPIMTNRNKKRRCSIPILKRIESHMDDMLARHKDVYFFRFDIRYPQGYAAPSDNRQFCAFQADYVKGLQRENYDVRYVAVREQENSSNQHYSEIVLVNVSPDPKGVVSKPELKPFIDSAEKIWERKLGLPPVDEDERDIPPECRKKNRGLIEDCTKSRYGSPQENGIMLSKSDPEYEEKINRCFHWGSYTAKGKQKDKTPPGQRELFSSRLSKTHTK